MKREELLTKVKQYIISTCNITEEEYKADIRRYLKKVLNDLKHSNVERIKLRIQRRKIREDIEDLEASMVGGEFRTPSEEGRNTGGRKNPPDFKAIQKLQLKEELGKLVNESLLLEKSLNDNNQLMLEFIHMLDNKTHQTVLELSYIECLRTVTIANQMFYTMDYLKQMKNRAVKKLAALLKN